MNAHVLGICVAFPLSHQAQTGAQVLAIGQTKFTNVAAGGGIKSYAITESETSYSCAVATSAGAVAADDMWKVDLNAGTPLLMEITFELTDAARSFTITSWFSWDRQWLRSEVDR
jgi:hypothetical protein